MDDDEPSLDDEETLVIDCGSGFCKVGFGGEDAPRAVFPTIIARDRVPTGANSSPKTVVGQDAQNWEAFPIQSSPVEHGEIMNWDDMAIIWHHVFTNVLRVDPSDYFLLLIDGSDDRHRSQAVEIMFETFQVGGIYVQRPETLALYASGRSVGVVLDSGHDLTQAVPISNGVAFKESIVGMNFAGLDLSLYLTKLLNERGLSFNTANDREIVQNMKEKLCHVALDIEKEMSSAIPKSFELPDGTAISLTKERLLCPEALFNPSLIGSEGQGIQHAVHQSITTIQEDSQEIFYNNIVLAGGSTLFEGLGPRLQSEVRVLAPNRRNINVVAPPRREYSAWVGGSMLASQTRFQSMFVPVHDYRACGSRMFYRDFLFE